MIYEPGEDSYLLEKYVKKFAKGKILDMGTGSGIQALAAEKKCNNVLAADINPEAIALLRKKGINAIKSDLFENIKGKFDTIIFNPPYLPDDSLEDEESKAITTGGLKGNEIINNFLRDAKSHLNKNGVILIVFSSLTGNVIKLFKKYNYNYELLESKKIFFEELYAYILKCH